MNGKTFNVDESRRDERGGGRGRGGRTSFHKATLPSVTFRSNGGIHRKPKSCLPLRVGIDSKMLITGSACGLSGTVRLPRVHGIQCHAVEGEDREWKGVWVEGGGGGGDETTRETRLKGCALTHLSQTSSRICWRCLRVCLLHARDTAVTDSSGWTSPQYITIYSTCFSYASSLLFQFYVSDAAACTQNLLSSAMLWYAS